MNLDYLDFNLPPAFLSPNNQGVVLVEEEEAVTIAWTLNSNRFFDCDYLKSTVFKVDNAIFNFFISKLDDDGNFSFKLQGGVLNFSIRLVLVTKTGNQMGGLFHNLFYITSNNIVMEPEQLCRRIGNNELVKLVATFFPETEAGIRISNRPIQVQQPFPALHEPLVIGGRQDAQALQMSKELKKKRHKGITAVWTVDLFESLNYISSLAVLPFDHNYHDYESVPFDLGDVSFQLWMRTYLGIIFVRLRRVQPMSHCALISFRLTVRTIDNKLLMHSFLENFDFNVNESHECSFMDSTTYGTTLSNYLATNKQLRIVCSLFREDRNCLNLENAGAIKNGQRGVLRDLEKLFSTKQNSDLTIEVENEKFEVHRSILSARCPFFDNMLQHDMVEKITGVVKIPHYTANVFKDFLLYLYTGQVNSFTTEKALSLYRAADEYDASDLRADCLSFMKRNLSISTVCDVIALSRKYDEKELLEKAKKFFAENPLDIIKTESWKVFLAEHFDEANQMYITAMEALAPKVKRRKL